jgi:hypothetical protein
MVQIDWVKINNATRCVTEELIKAQQRFKPFNSSHEGYAVLHEEVDELWDAIKANDLDHAQIEAVQVAAMALRYIIETPGVKKYESE